ncbi:MAG TPA: mandelate racemase/muconate lactonizing enzyme family protein, partial [Alphaproteobacteria bacterium]
LTAVIRGLAELVVGEDARATERITAKLYAKTRHAAGGMIQQAIAALENALIDVKARALGVPVYELFGGPVRDRFRLYWSHCGSYRVHHAQLMGKPAVRSLADLTLLAREVRAAGFTALKTNIFLFDQDTPALYMPGFAAHAGFPELNPSTRVIDALRAQLGALREGAGREVDILLDLNFNFKTEGFIAVARALDDLGLTWIEIDSYDPKALRDIRSAVNTPIASCESLFGRRGFRPYLEQRAMDTAIVDVPWNGIAEALKIAAMAEAYEVNVAPHNFYGHLSTLMSAHFCAALSNFRIMEIDIDDVPWKDDLVTVPPRIENGHLVLPEGPGWGAELNEAAIRAHPPKR